MRIIVRGQEVDRIFFLTLMSFCSVAMAVGTLQIGTVTVENDQVVIPVLLGGEVSSGVASLNFRLNYDPDVLYPVSVAAGEAAMAAQKQVMASAKPGEYLVVMMGMNQEVCRSGEVARLVMQRQGGATGNDWGLNITSQCLASSSGEVIESRALPYNGPDDTPEEPDRDDDGSRPRHDRSGQQEPARTDTDPEQPNTGLDPTSAEPVRPLFDAGPANELAAALKAAQNARARLETPRPPTPLKASGGSDPAEKDMPATVVGDEQKSPGENAKSGLPDMAEHIKVAAAIQPSSPTSTAAAPAVPDPRQSGAGRPVAWVAGLVAAAAILLAAGLVAGRRIAKGFPRREDA